MPTNRVRKTRSARPDVSPTVWAMLNDLEMPPGVNKWQHFDGVPRALWEQHRDEVLREWIRDRPGSRPSYWWQFDAPRLPEDRHVRRHFV